MSAAGTAGAGEAYRARIVEAPEPTPAPAIAVEGLVHSFGAKSVLRGVSFEVPRGSVYGFIGPNGAGKTTTLRILATLLEPSAGTARIAGHDVTSHPERARRVLGYMPDGPAVHERVSVGEHLDFFASAHGLRGEARRQSVARALEITGMGPLRASAIPALSKGQKQRMLLARTLLHDPEVLLLDEPASDLDPRARIELRALLAELARLGKTVLLSSHILTELAELCDSVGVLEGGRIVVSGSVADVQAKAFPGRRVRVTVLDRGPEAAARLRDCPGVASVSTLDVERPGTVLEVVYEGDDWVVAGLVGALAEAQIAVCAVEPGRADLERIFMDVTRTDGGP